MAKFNLAERSMPLPDRASAIARAISADALLATLTAVGKACRSEIRRICARQNACIETAYLVELALAELGIASDRLVCAVQSFSPALAKRIAEGAELRPELALEPRCWSVAIGRPELPGDYVGRFDLERNRFVGHVINRVRLPSGVAYLDASIDQISRPEKDMAIDGPMVTLGIQDADGFLVRDQGGVVLKYWLFSGIAVPDPKSERMLGRQARSVSARLRLA